MKIKSKSNGLWTRRRVTSWSNWTFGPWMDTIGKRRCYGIDLGPVAWTWERRLG